MLIELAYVFVWNALQEVAVVQGHTDAKAIVEEGWIKGKEEKEKKRANLKIKNIKGKERDRQKDTEREREK